MLYYKMTIKSKIQVNNMVEGQSIEEKMRRVMLSGEPIDDTAPLVFTDMKDGVQPQYDIRTDRFEVAQDAMDKVNKSLIAKAAEQIKPQEKVQEKNVELEV